jgi:hypothetical protein
VSKASVDDHIRACQQNTKSTETKQCLESLTSKSLMQSQITSLFILLFPLGPRIRSSLDALDDASDGKLKILDLLGYHDFLGLMSNVRLVILVVNR